MLKVGEKYLVRATNRNEKNGLIAGKEARIAHVGTSAVSVRVFQNGSELKLLVPKDLFGTAFDQDRSYTPPNLAYTALTPFPKAYV